MSHLSDRIASINQQWMSIAAFNIPAGAVNRARIPFDTALPWGLRELAPPIFTPIRTGFYHFSVQVLVLSAAVADAISIELYEDTPVFTRLSYTEWFAFGPAVGNSITIVKDVYCVAGRNYSVWCYYIGGAGIPTVRGAIDQTYFSVHRVR